MPTENDSRRHSCHCRLPKERRAVVMENEPAACPKSGAHREWAVVPVMCHHHGLLGTLATHEPPPWATLVLGRSGGGQVEMLDTEMGSGKGREPGRRFPSQCCPAHRCPSGKHPAQAPQKLKGRNLEPYTFLLPQTHLPAQVPQTAGGLLTVSALALLQPKATHGPGGRTSSSPSLAPFPCLVIEKNPKLLACLSSQLGAAELGAPLESLRARCEKQKTTSDVSVPAFPHPKAV